MRGLDDRGTGIVTAVLAFRCRAWDPCLRLRWIVL